MAETSREPGRRTFVVSAGKFVKDFYENEIAAECARIGVTCETHEHPRLLTTEVAFTVSGPEPALNEFENYAAALAGGTIRAVDGPAAQALRMGL